MSFFDKIDNYLIVNAIKEILNAEKSLNLQLKTVLYVVL